MNIIHRLCLIACLLTATLANKYGNSLDNYLSPSNWISEAEIQALPEVNEVNMRRLESMSVDEGAKLLDQMYHLSQFNRVFKPNYSPTPNQITGYIVTSKGQKMPFNLANFVSVVKQQKDFGNEELTLFITGLPQTWPSVGKATHKLIEAYMQRYNWQSNSNDMRSIYSSSEDLYNKEDDSKDIDDKDVEKKLNGDLVVIDLGDTIKDFEKYTTFNIEQIGNLIGQRLVQLTNQVDVPQEIIHLIGHGIGAHVAGVAGRQYVRLTGHKLRRITGLDPSRIYGKAQRTLNGLARGDADFVDVIHTSAYGMGSSERFGNADFYPNGPDTGVPGADNVVEASLRAVRYFAESVRPGNERNFPAVAATSFKEYKQNYGYGKRVYMGLAVDYDIEGDYMLQVNSKSPFGKSTPAQRQIGYHAIHEPWNNEKSLY